MKELSFCSFSSGSSGNCYLVKTAETAILVDSGISAKKILAGLDETETGEDQLKALLITHEHSDHIKSLGTMMKKRKQLCAYANEKTWGAIEKECDPRRKKIIQTGEVFLVGDIEIKSFSLCHDAVDPVGYSLRAGGRQVTIVTDTGCIPEAMMEEVCRADLLVLEANHDVNMLKIGRYPWFLKQRILGDKGHLSNESAAHAIVHLMQKDERKRRILLAHLSQENNFPEMAFQTVKNIMEEEEHLLGRDIDIDMIIRDEISAVFSV